VAGCAVKTFVIVMERSYATLTIRILRSRV